MKMFAEIWLFIYFYPIPMYYWLIIMIIFYGFYASIMLFDISVKPLFAVLFILFFWHYISRGNI